MKAIKINGLFFSSSLGWKKDIKYATHYDDAVAEFIVDRWQHGDKTHKGERMYPKWHAVIDGVGFGYCLVMVTETKIVNGQKKKTTRIETQYKTPVIELISV